MTWNLITEVTDEHGNKAEASSLYESSKHNDARFHRTCGHKYNRQKIERLQEKLNVSEQVSPSTPSTRSSFEKKDVGSYFCAICNQTDVPENLHDRGTFNATKRNFKYQNENDAIDIWRSMALKVGKENLLIQLSVGGDIFSNELYFHSQ